MKSAIKQFKALRSMGCTWDEAVSQTFKHWPNWLRITALCVGWWLATLATCIVAFGVVNIVYTL